MVGAEGQSFEDLHLTNLILFCKISWEIMVARFRDNIESTNAATMTF